MSAARGSELSQDLSSDPGALPRHRQNIVIRAPSAEECSGNRRRTERKPLCVKWFRRPFTRGVRCPSGAVACSRSRRSADPARRGCPWPTAERKGAWPPLADPLAVVSFPRGPLPAQGGAPRGTSDSNATPTRHGRKPAPIRGHTWCRSAYLPRARRTPSPRGRWHFGWVSEGGSLRRPGGASGGRRRRGGRARGRRAAAALG